MTSLTNTMTKPARSAEFVTKSIRMNQVELERLTKIATELGEKKFISYINLKVRAPYFSNALEVALTLRFKAAIDFILNKAKEFDNLVYYNIIPSLSAYETLVANKFAINLNCLFKTAERKEYNNDLRFILLAMKKKDNAFDLEGTSSKIVDHAITVGNLELASILLE